MPIYVSNEQIDRFGLRLYYWFSTRVLTESKEQKKLSWIGPIRRKARYSKLVHFIFYAKLISSIWGFKFDVDRKKCLFQNNNKYFGDGFCCVINN